MERFRQSKTVAEDTSLASPLNIAQKNGVKIVDNIMDWSGYQWNSVRMAKPEDTLDIPSNSGDYVIDNDGVVWKAIKLNMAGNALGFAFGTHPVVDVTRLARNGVRGVFDKNKPAANNDSYGPGSDLRTQEIKRYEEAA